MLMQKFKGFGIFVLFAFLTISNRVYSQSAYAIALNEYMVTNTQGFPAVDNYGKPEDWVEIYNAHTASVSLGGYYLSNDRTNLTKWRIPNTCTMTVGAYQIIWFSGRNESKLQGGQWHYHTNFTIDQCKDQWIILTAPNGVVRDSIAVQKTQENHSRGRLLGDYSTIGVNGWRVYTAHTFSAANNNPGYLNYCPTPNFTEPPGIGTISTPTFEIFNTWAGMPIDTTCYRVYFTIDGSFPWPNVPNPYGPVGTSQEFIDAVTPMIVPPAQTTMFRAMCYPNFSLTPSPPTYCQLNYLPSFCQTNTYFTENGHMIPDFSDKFGILSLAIEPLTDLATWFSVGTPATTVHAEYFELKATDPKKFVQEGYAQMTKPVNESWLSFQKGFNLNIDDRRGFGCNFEGQMFNVPELGTSTRTLFTTLHVSGGDFEAHSAPASNPINPSFGTGLRDVFMQTLAAKNNIDVNPLHIKPIAMFVNGKYWGTYNLKEIYDEDYEVFYNQQPKKDLTMLFYHNGEGIVTTSTVTNNWFGHPSVDTYSFVNLYSFWTTKPTVVSNTYNTLKKRLNIPNFIDWNILNSYAQNSNLYNYNIAFAKGTNTLTGGGRWHHYLWNTPAVFQYTAIAQNTYFYNSPQSSPCAIAQATYPLSPNKYNGQGIIFNKLMNENGGVGNAEFKRDYITRYQDLLNGPLSCVEILKHWQNINDIYRPEMKKHEDPATPPFPSPFAQQTDVWDTNMSVLKRAIEKRCEFMETAFSKTVSCYGLVGPYDITVDVRPAGAGKVKLNTTWLPYYIWGGKYFKSEMTFRAVPNDSAYVFDHWELENHPEKNGRPLSLDSIGIDFSNTLGEKVVAVFTDRQKDSGIPSAFSPNGDGINDVFGILGSGKYSDNFEMRIWNRWGQEVFRSTDPTVGWNGNFNGAQAQPGVYAYYITYKNLFGEDKVVKGNVTLVR